jgi:hypothetical protein
MHVIRCIFAGWWYFLRIGFTVYASLFYTLFSFSSARSMLFFYAKHDSLSWLSVPVLTTRIHCTIYCTFFAKVHCFFNENLAISYHSYTYLSYLCMNNLAIGLPALASFSLLPRTHSIRPKVQKWNRKSSWNKRSKKISKCPSILCQST